MTWSSTQGADLNWARCLLPIHLKLTYERTFYGTGYQIVQRFLARGLNVTAPLCGWAGNEPQLDVAALVADAGSGLAPPAAGRLETSAAGNVSDGASLVIVDFADGPAQWRLIRLTAPASEAAALEQSKIRIIWDGRAAPSVDVPIPFFFGSGSLFNRSGTDALVKAVPVSIQFSNGNVTLSTYFPMPYFREARIEIVGGAMGLPALRWTLRREPLRSEPRHTGYFHATYVDHGIPTPGHDLVLLDTRGIEGSTDWCGQRGQLVGTAFTFSDQANLTTLACDPRFNFDDSETPQAQGTGIEEWAGGGDWWGGQTTTLPLAGLAGHLSGAPGPGSMSNAGDGIESAHRYLLADMFPFGRNARIQLEHGGWDDTTDHYQSVVSWYGLPGACLVTADSLHVGDATDEGTHSYLAASTVPVALTSRFEAGVDHLPDGGEVFPATTDTGRLSSGSSEFVLRLSPDNLGALLRRRFDQAIPDQRARVEVGDVDGGSLELAGVWYSPGSNTCIYSYPGSELAPAVPIVETSNRRWCEEELLIPWQLTRGRSALRIRVTPLLAPYADAGVPAWSEYRYWLYAWQLPPSP